MKRNIYVAALFVFMASVLTVVTLFLASDSMVHRRNAFLRQFPPHVLAEDDTFDVRFNSFYIAGGTAHTAYLGNTTSPSNLVEVNLDASNIKSITLQAKSIDTIRFWAPRIKVDSPFFYFADGTRPVIYRGTTSDWSICGKAFGNAYFVDFTLAGSSSILVRSVSSSTQEYVLGKEVDGMVPQFTPTLLQKQIDGRFCVDGMLHYDGNGRLVYVYYYRNQFIVADTSLNLVYRGKTIDTVSHAQIHIASIASKKMNTHTAPPLYVNKHSCTWNGLLFVNSGLLSRNEDRQLFLDSSVIDVYDLANGHYRFSFYIPGVNGKKMHDFAVFGNRLFVLIDTRVFTWKLEPFYFRNM
jgi:hypothetical protein